MQTDWTWKRRGCKRFVSAPGKVRLQYTAQRVDRRHGHLLRLSGRTSRSTATPLALLRRSVLSYLPASNRLMIARRHTHPYTPIIRPMAKSVGLHSPSVCVALSPSGWSKISNDALNEAKTTARMEPSAKQKKRMEGGTHMVLEWKCGQPEATVKYLPLSPAVTFVYRLPETILLASGCMRFAIDEQIQS